MTERLRQVLQGMADGKTNDEIAAWLHVSPNTVKSHRLRLLAALEAHNAANAVALGIRAGLIQ
jgi:DNA-binding NarL/FixJ family response regulator